MNPVNTALHRRAAELLGDGQWHDYETVIMALVKLIPPGVARRRYERELASSRQLRRRQGLKEITNAGAPLLAVEDQIRSGARTIVRDLFSNERVYERKPKRFEYSARNAPPRQIRMLATPRAISSDWFKARADQLEVQNMRLRDQVITLRKFLIDIGHAEDAERLAPELDDGP